MNIEENSLPLLGDDFPKLNVQTTHGMMKLPDAFEGKWFILFSHPSDFTPVCTTEFVSFQKNYGEFKKLNCELIGLSVDQVFSHIKWVEWIKDNLDVEIEFPIIADTGVVASSLGIIHPGKGTTTVRSVFVVDNNGKIRTILHYPQEMGRNIKEILRIVKGLQTGDKNKVAMPANWPENEIVSDEVIIPPIPTMDAIKKRNKQRENGEISGYDWWFCHKKL
ncbi:MAG: peroxiredoxin [Methanobrevibacter sp.]|nr:peroxiredoxin [Methanobrevibacter sp.]MEA4956241.1 peroxiredoxin [Methanobrevibacter sp.]